MRGRKPIYESRAAEFRRVLTAWKTAPPSLRPSLRKLARELNTSHQLLEYYLARLEIDRAQAMLALRLADAKKRRVNLTPEQAKAIGQRVAAYRVSREQSE